MTEIILNQETVEQGSLQNFKQQSDELIAQCSRVVVTDHKTFGAVGDLVKIGNSKLKEMDEIRLEETKKPREYTTWVNKRFGDLTGPLKEAQGSPLQ